MKLKQRIGAVAFIGHLLLLVSAGTAFSGEEFVVRGADWTTSSDDQRRAFLAGMATMIEIEQELQAKSPSNNVKSTVPTLVEGFKDMTIGQIKDAIDEHYATSKDLDTPVFNVIWDLAKANQ